MTLIELTQEEYVSATALVRAAAEEHARARVELDMAQASRDMERIAVASLRSSYATKLWETRLGQEVRALRAYNEQLRQEGERLQRSEALRQSDERGQVPDTER